MKPIFAKNCFTLILCFLFLVSISAQKLVPAKYTDVNQVEHFGQVDAISSNFDTKIEFIENGIKVTLSPIPGESIDIEAYGIFTALENHSYFIQLMVGGKINLYDHKNELLFQKDGKVYTIQPPDARLVETSNKWKGIVALLTNDCSDQNFNSNLIRYNKDRIIQTIKSYNECKNELSYFFDPNPKDRYKIFLGPMAGLGYSRIFIKELNESFLGYQYAFGSPQSFDYSVGGNFLFRSTGKYERLAVGLSPSFTILNFKSKAVKEGFTFNSQIESQIEFRSILIPFYIHYIFYPGEKFSITGNLGFGARINQYRNFHAFLTNLYNFGNVPPWTREADFTVVLRNFQLILVSFGPGIIKKQGKDMWALDLKFNIYSTFLKTGTNVENINGSATLNISYFFGI